jgi:hypothetical protein
LKVCKSAGTLSPSLVGDLFSFTENGNPAFSVAAGTVAAPNCGPVTKFKLGTVVNVAELATAGTHVSGITVSDGRGSNVNAASGTVTATVGSGVTVVTYTNDVTVNAPTGFIEVCKSTQDEFVSGSFNFTITDALGAVSQQSVLVGQCTAPLQVAAGNATVTEAAQFPTYVDGIVVLPSGRTVSSNLSNRTVTVKVVAGDSSTETVVDFDNATLRGNFKVCKTLTANSSALAGQPFYFDVVDAFGPHTDTVYAGAAGTTACIIDFDNPPLGSPVSITEESTPNVVNTAVSVSPASNDTGSFVPTANLKISAGFTTATFTNQAFGTIEVCKDPVDTSFPTPIFQFEVNNGAPISVHAGQCSPAISVPAGSASVLELDKTDFHFVSVATSPTNRLTSLPTVNPATVLTPFGGVANETVVTFTNAHDTGQFKICKASTEPSLQNTEFLFGWSYLGGLFHGSVLLKPGECSGLSVPIPVSDDNGIHVGITITETVPASVQVTEVKVANGTLISVQNDNTGGFDSPLLFPAHNDDYVNPASLALPVQGPNVAEAVINVSKGVTAVTFTNTRAPIPCDPTAPNPTC